MGELLAKSDYANADKRLVSVGPSAGDSRFFRFRRNYSPTSNVDPAAGASCGMGSTCR